MNPGHLAIMDHLAKSATAYWPYLAKSAVLAIVQIAQRMEGGLKFVFIQLGPKPTLLTFLPSSFT